MFNTDYFVEECMEAGKQGAGMILQCIKCGARTTEQQYNERRHALCGGLFAPLWRSYQLDAFEILIKPIANGVR